MYAHPNHGLWKGNTRVEIRGWEFFSFDQFTKCNFGTIQTEISLIDETHASCFSPPSEVVGRAVPFSISWNG